MQNDLNCSPLTSPRVLNSWLSTMTCSIASVRPAATAVMRVAASSLKRISAFSVSARRTVANSTAVRTRPASSVMAAESETESLTRRKIFSMTTIYTPRPEKPANVPGELSIYAERAETYVRYRTYRRTSYEIHSDLKVQAHATLYAYSQEPLEAGVNT